MAKLFSAFALLVFLTPAFAMDQDGRVGRLRDVRTVYVAELGRTDRARSLREEIIKSLTASQRIRLADDPEKADAVLSLRFKSVSKNVDSPYEAFGEPGLKTGSRVIQTSEVILTLSSHQDSKLWAARFASEGYPGTEKQAERSLANTVSRRFLRAVEKDRRKRH